MYTVVTVAAMTAIFAAHVLMMLELRPRRDDGNQIETETTLGETS